MERRQHRERVSTPDGRRQLLQWLLQLLQLLLVAGVSVSVGGHARARQLFGHFVQFAFGVDVLLRAEIAPVPAAGRGRDSLDQFLRQGLEAGFQDARAAARLVAAATAAAAVLAGATGAAGATAVPAIAVVVAVGAVVVVVVVAAARPLRQWRQRGSGLDRERDWRGGGGGGGDGDGGGGGAVEQRQGADVGAPERRIDDGRRTGDGALGVVEVVDRHGHAVDQEEAGAAQVVGVGRKVAPLEPIAHSAVLQREVGERKVDEGSRVADLERSVRLGWWDRVVPRNAGVEPVGAAGVGGIAQPDKVGRQKAGAGLDQLGGNVEPPCVGLLE